MARKIPDVTLKDALAAYGRWRAASFSRATWVGESSGLHQFVDFFGGGETYLSALTPGRVRLWWDMLDGLAESTKVTRLGQVRAFLRYCREQGWLEGDPTALLRAAKPMPTIRERLTADELLALIDAAEFPQHRLVLALGANLGLRGGEIKDLRIRDVNLDSATLRVRIHKTKQVDDMPINTDLAAELRSWLDHYAATCAGLRPDSRLVPAQHVNPTTNTITYYPERPVAEPFAVVKRALTQLGWDNVKQEGVHTLRRSVARIFFDDAEATDGFDNALIGTMSLLHHNRAETTLRYIGVDRQAKARDEHLRDRPFLTRLAQGNVLRIAR